MRARKSRDTRFLDSLTHDSRAKGPVRAEPVNTRKTKEMIHTDAVVIFFKFLSKEIQIQKINKYAVLYTDFLKLLFKNAYCYPE
jgi:hypothetical protein